MFLSSLTFCSNNCHGNKLGNCSWHWQMPHTVDCYLSHSWDDIHASESLVGNKSPVLCGKLSQLRNKSSQNHWHPTFKQNFKRFSATFFILRTEKRVFIPFALRFGINPGSPRCLEHPSSLWTQSVTWCIFVMKTLMPRRNVGPRNIRSTLPLYSWLPSQV